MFNWQQVETVLLDMDGTLLDLHYDNFFWNKYLPSYYAKLNDMSEHDARNLLINKFRAKQGQLEFYCIEYWSQELSIDLLPVKKQVQDRIQFLPGAQILLQHLKLLPLETLIVTNAHPDTLQLKHDILDIETYVDVAYASHDFGLPKENPQFWHHLIKKHPFNPAKTVLIDDNQAVLASAKTFEIANLILPLLPDSQKPPQHYDKEGTFLPIHSLLELVPNNA